MTTHRVPMPLPPRASWLPPERKRRVAPSPPAFMVTVLASTSNPQFPQDSGWYACTCHRSGRVQFIAVARSTPVRKRTDGRTRERERREREREKEKEREREREIIREREREREREMWPFAQNVSRMRGNHWELTMRKIDTTCKGY